MTCSIVVQVATIIHLRHSLDIRSIAAMLTGGAFGVPLALWASKYLASILYGLTPRDPGTIAFTAAMLIGIATLAGYLPARRAALVDPARALKQD